jgi:BRCT domain type II-containing protein
MPTLKRTEAEQMVEEHGGKLLSGVSSKLTYLVSGEDAGSKLEKAKKNRYHQNNLGKRVPGYIKKIIHRFSTV